MSGAVNIYDLMNLQKLDPVGALLFPPACFGDVVAADNERIGGDAIVLNFDDARFLAIVQLLRGKYSKIGMRLYYRKSGKGGWKRV